MKIAILDDEHYNYLYTLCRLFNFGDNKIYGFVDEMTHQKIKDCSQNDYDNYRWIIKQDNISMFKYLKKVKDTIERENIALLFINGIYNNYFAYVYLMHYVKSFKVITIHNVNSWFKMSFSRREAVRNIVKRKILDLSDAVNVLTEEIRYYIDERFNYKKHIFNIPFTLYEGCNAPFINDDMIKFVIVGQIEEKRKDYDSVLDVFKRLFFTYKNISLVLLGKPFGDYGKKIIKKCRDIIRETNGDIRYFNEFVPDSEFKEIILSAHVLIAPININTEFDGTKEIYGITKATGSIFDVISFSKPGIFPVKLRTPQELEDSILKYSEETELEIIIRRILEDKAFLVQLLNTARKNSEKYSLNVKRNQIIKEFSEVGLTMGGNDE